MNDLIKIVSKGIGCLLITSGVFNLFAAFISIFVPRLREPLLKQGLFMGIGAWSFLVSICACMLIVGFWLISKEDFPTIQELPGLAFKAVRYAVGMYAIFLGGLLVIAFPIIPFIANGTIGAALFSLIFGGGLVFTGTAIVGKGNL